MSSKKKNKKSPKNTSEPKQTDADSSQLPDKEQEAVAASEPLTREEIDEINADLGYVISFFS